MNNRNRSSFTALLISLMFIVPTSQAAIGTLADSPLFLSSSTEPNVVFYWMIRAVWNGKPWCKVA